MGTNFRKFLEENLEKPSTSGSLLKAFRRSLKLSQDDLAAITGVHRPNISAIENSTDAMSAHYADIFAAALGVHPATFLYPEGKFTKDSELRKIERKAQKVIEKKRAV